MKRWKVILLVALIVALLFVICKLTFAANRGLDSMGVAYMCTEAGTIEGTSTDTPMINPIVVKSIVFVESASTDTLILTDGTNVETMLKFKGSQVIDFGEGKRFPKGLRVHSMTSGGTLFIYPK
jgi:hypothetical protein